MAIGEYWEHCKDFIKRGPVRKAGYILGGLGVIASCYYFLPKCTHENDGDSKKNECADTNCGSTVYNISDSTVYFNSDGKISHSVGKRGKTHVRKPTRTSSRADHCGESLCNTPEEYSHAIVACTGYDHCGTGNSDSEHELLISEEGLERRVLEIVNENVSYENEHTIRLNYKKGFNGPGNGARLNNLFGVAQDADNCSRYKKINIGEEIPGGFELVMLYGYDNEGNLYRIASSYIGKRAPADRRTTRKAKPEPKVEEPTPQPKPQPKPKPQPPEENLEGRLDGPTLTDNYDNVVDFNTNYPQLFIAFCEGGTNGHGKVIRDCENYIEDFPIIIFNRRKDGKYGAYIPNIPGTKEASYRVVGHLDENGQKHLEENASRKLNIQGNVVSNPSPTPQVNTPAQPAANEEGCDLQLRMRGQPIIVHCINGDGRVFSSNLGKGVVLTYSLDHPTDSFVGKPRVNLYSLSGELLQSSGYFNVIAYTNLGKIILNTLSDIPDKSKIVFESNVMVNNKIKKESLELIIEKE